MPYANVAPRWPVGLTDTAASKNGLKTPMSSAMTIRLIAAIPVYCYNFFTSCMPHLGHRPGAFCTTWGCMGQV